MTSSPHGPYVLGNTRVTMSVTMGCQAARWSKSPKDRLSTDCRLKFACMKLESLVMAYHHDAVNTFPGLVHTARQALKVGGARSLEYSRSR